MHAKNDAMSRDLKLEFRRQMRSAQIRRIVSALPVYNVEPELPERFVKLLRKLDRISELDPSGPGTQTARAGARR